MVALKERSTCSRATLGATLQLRDEGEGPHETQLSEKFEQDLSVCFYISQYDPRLTIK